MTFELAPADRDALKQVDINIPGTKDNMDASDIGSEEAGIHLNEETLMFPPKVTKDNKSAQWKEWISGGYEPGKFYLYSSPRQIGLEFQWVIGTHKKFTPSKLRGILSGVRAYFYSPFFGGDRYNYPAAYIYALYEIIPRGLWSEGRGSLAAWGGANTKNSKPSSWRVMDSNIKYSEQLVQLDGIWHPLHTTLTLNLESVSQIASKKEGEEGPMSSFGNLPRRPRFEWF